MSREKLIATPVRLAGDVLERIDGVAGPGKRAEFIRRAVMAALEGGVFGLGAEAVKAGIEGGDQLEPVGVSLVAGSDSEHRDEAGAERERGLRKPPISCGRADGAKGLALTAQRAPVARSVLAAEPKRKQTIEDVPERWRDGARRFVAVLAGKTRTLGAVASEAELTQGLAIRLENELVSRGIVVNRGGMLSVADGASGL